MRFAELAAVSAEVRGTRSRTKKIAHLSACLRAAGPAELPAAAAYLAGQLPQGKIGLGHSAVRDLMEEIGAPAEGGGVSVADVDRTVTEIAVRSGAGSVRARRALLGGLLARMDQAERRLLVGLILGELRQGASEGIMAEAIAAAFELDAKLARRAIMLSGDLGRVASAALEGGSSALRAFQVELFRPLMPMLAQPAGDIEEVFGLMEGEAAFELKLDGARVQAHKDGGEVRVYSRRLNDVTAAVPEVVELVRELPTERAVLDGEAIALRQDRTPQPFQVTMRRFGRRRDTDRLRRELPLSCFFFDALVLGPGDLLDDPTSTRIQALEEVVPSGARVERITTADPDEAGRFWRHALDRGHEGVMAKALDAPYAAGSRGKAWLKLKPAHTLDLVVLAAEWGSGRRKGWLSNLHLGARDPRTGDFVMLGKTFKGLTDERLAWQTEQLLARQTDDEDGWVVHVRPELVVEIAFNDVQQSPHYPAGMALRFARVLRYRADKPAAAADTIDRVREIFEGARR